MSFTTLGLSAPLLQAIAARGYTVPTPVQSAAIPAILKEGDVWACAQTGSGKTAAFVLPILEKILAARKQSPRRLQALILVPTRELASQIGESIRHYSRSMPEPVKVICVFGGVSINPQMMRLRGGADIVVATPGRLLDLVDHNALDLSRLNTLVLDEADRLLDLGFAEELARILALLPDRRQNLLFSATFPPAVQTLANGILREPTRIEVEQVPASAPDIQQRAIETDIPRRTQLLRHLIQSNGWTRTLVFVATKYSTEHVADKLRKAGIRAMSFHGEMSQGARTMALNDFKNSLINVLIATDLAARGIDISHLPVVVNYDLPRSATDYVHRIGRTGRAGQNGVAISFVTAESAAHFRLIEKRNGLRIEREVVPGFEPTTTGERLPPATGGIKGRRKSKKDKLREAAAAAAQSPPSA